MNSSCNFFLAFLLILNCPSFVRLFDLLLNYLSCLYSVWHSFPFGAVFIVSHVIFRNVTFDSSTHFFFSFLQCPDVCPEVYCSLLCLCICSSPLLFETGVSAELHQLTVSFSRLPVNSLLFPRGAWLQPVCLHASFSTRDFYRWGHIPSSFLVLFM